MWWGGGECLSGKVEVGCTLVLGWGSRCVPEWGWGSGLCT